MIRPLVDFATNFLQGFIQFIKNHPLTHFICIITKICFVPLLAFFLAGYLPNLRNPLIVSSTKQLISLIKTSNYFHALYFFMKSYWLQIFMGLLFIFFCLGSLIKSYRTMKSNKIIQFKHSYLFQIFLLLVVNYFINGYLLNSANESYQQFYDSFKKGTLDKPSSVDLTLFPGFRKYSFLSHKEETFRLFKEHLHDNAFQLNKTQILLFKNLLEQQDKSLSTLGSYFANYRLVFNIGKISQPYIMGIFILVSIIILIMFRKIAKKVQQFPIVKYQQIHQNQQQMPEKTDKSQGNKVNKSFIFCYLFILAFFGIVCLIFYLNAEITTEFNHGLRKDNNKNQQELCSFHKKMGGFIVNLNYQHQLDIKRIVENIQQSHKSAPFTKQLQRKLSFYTSFCEILTPYYKQSRQIQIKLSQLFYGNFLCMLYVFYMVVQLKLAQNQ